MNFGKIISILAFCLPLCTCMNSQAQRYKRTAIHETPQERLGEATYKAYEDSLARLVERYGTWKYAGGDTLSNPYYFMLFSPSTFYSGPVHRSIGQLVSTEKERAQGSLGLYGLEAGADSLWNYIYTRQPWLVQYDESLLRKDEGIRTDLPREVKPEIKLSDQKEDAPAAGEPVTTGTTDLANWGIVVRKPNFWDFNTNVSLQFVQNHVSDNWYKGGESNNSLLAGLVIDANYNNKQKVLFSNKLEMKLGFQSSKNDEEHKYKTNSDQIRLTNKLGLRATKHWYYTLMLQSWTQFYRGYKSNDKNVYSDFMSPFESLFSIGMDYKLDKSKFHLSATMSPIAFDFKYVGRESLATSFGLDEGKHTKINYGSNITMNYSWDIVKNVKWQGRLYFFTDYSKVQLEWENTFNLQINRFLSTRLFLYPRFDDSVGRKEGSSYIQFYELLSLGLNVNF